MFWANQRIPGTIAEAGAADLTTEAGKETTTGAAPHTSIIEPHS